MKNSKKKFWLSMSGIVLSVMMLSVTALAASDSLTGYNKFKEMIIKSALESDSLIDASDNSTTTSSITLKKDQEEMVSVHAITKNHIEADTVFSSTKSTSTSIFGNVTNETWSESSDTQDVFVRKSSDNEKYTAYVWEHENYQRYDEDYSEFEEADTSLTPAQDRLMNALIDLVAGDTKSQFRTEGDTVSIHLEGAQIPELGQLAVSVVEEQMKKEFEDTRSFKSNDPVHQVCQELGLDLKNLTLEVIHAELTFEESQIRSLSAQIVISGMDSNGVKHMLEIDGEVLQSDIGTTTADKINLDDLGDNLIITENGFYTDDNIYDMPIIVSGNSDITNSYVLRTSDIVESIE